MATTTDTIRRKLCSEAATLLREAQLELHTEAIRQGLDGGTTPRTKLLAQLSVNCGVLAERLYLAALPDGCVDYRGEDEDISAKILYTSGRAQVCGEGASQAVADLARSLGMSGRLAPLDVLAYAAKSESPAPGPWTAYRAVELVLEALKSHPEFASWWGDLGVSDQVHLHRRATEEITSLLSVENDGDERTLISCLTAALAPNEIVQPMELVQRATAYRRHSEKLHEIRGQMLRELAEGPIPHDAVDEVADDVVLRVGSVLEALELLTDAVDAARRS